jgi:hypothetical protein
MVRFFAHGATNTGVQILAVALGCAALGAVAWASGQRGVGIGLFIAGGVLLLIALIAFALVARRQEKEPERPALHEIIRIKGEEKPTVIDGTYRGKYLRIKFTNTSTSIDLVCHARLESLQFSKSADGSFDQPTWFSPGLLWWAKPDGGSDTVRLGRGTNRSCDLVCYESRDDERAKIVWADHTLRTPGVLFEAYWLVAIRLEAEGFMPLDLAAVVRWRVAKYGPVFLKSGLLTDKKERVEDELLAFEIEPHLSEPPAVARLNDLIERGDGLAEAILDQGDRAIVADEEAWRVAAEECIAVHCDRSLLTDFRTARDPEHPKRGAMSGSWSRLNRIMAQVEVLKRCRDRLAG